MIGRDASRDAKYSILTMVLLGLALLVTLSYAIDRLLLRGLYASRFLEFCRALEATCQNALFSISLTPALVLTMLFSTALVFAILRAALILFSSKRKMANFLETPGRKSSNYMIKFNETVRGLAGSELLPEIKILTNREPLAFTAGLLNQCIYLSRGLIGTLDKKELEAVILHELAHIKRKDNLAIFSMLFLRNFLFGLPLSHFLFRIYVREKENAADDYVVAEMKEPTSLASAILKLVRLNHLKNDPSPAYATFFPSPATARSRIARLTGSDVPKRAREVVNLILATVASALIVVLLAGATFQASAASNTNCARSEIVCKDKTNCLGRDHGCCAQLSQK